MKAISKDNDSSFRKRLLEKLTINDHLSGLDKQYILNFLVFHENCSGIPSSRCTSIPPTNDSTTSNGKRILNGNHSNYSKKKKTVDAETQCRRYYQPDNETMMKYLREYETSEEKNIEVFNAYSENLYDNRRASIMAPTPPPVKVFQERHPYMFNYSQVTTEFKLITQRSDIYNKFISVVEKYCYSVLGLVPPTPTGNMIHKKIMQAENEETKKWIRMAGSLLLLPKYMDEERKGILLCNNEKAIQFETYPYISYAADTDSCLEKNTSFKIFIEGIELCTANNLVDAYFALVATYYMFNAVYPDACKNSFAVIENLYIEYTDQSTGLSSFVEERIKYLKKDCQKRGRA